MTTLNRASDEAANGFAHCRMTKFSATLAVLFALIAPSASHAVLIDAFGTPQAALEDFAGPSTTSSSVSGPDIIGGERDALVGSTTMPGVTGATRFRAVGGFAIFSADPFGDGQVRLDYDGSGSPFDGTSGVPMDFSDAGASDRFIIEVSALSGVAQVIVMAGAAGIVESLQSDWINLTVGTVEIPFSAFHLVGGPSPGQNFQAAGQLMLSFQMFDGSAASVDAICSGAAGGRCSSTIAVVPTPPTLSLMLLGLVGLVAQRWLAVLRRSRRNLDWLGSNPQ